MLNLRGLKAEMSNQAQKIADLLNDIEIKCDPAVGSRACTQFSLDCLSLIRAVIFPLDAQKNPEERDVVNHLGLFLEFVNTVEPHYEEEEALLRRHFADCIETR